MPQCSVRERVAFADRNGALLRSRRIIESKDDKSNLKRSAHIGPLRPR
jgi:hypothetical protein